MSGYRYHQVFSLLDKPCPYWLCLFGLAPVLLGAVVMLLTSRKGKGLIMCAGGVVWLLLTCPILLNCHALRRALIEGRALTVEGRVEQFHPMPEGGHDEEHFTVAGKLFAYSDYEVMAGFNNTSSHGGPIRAGLRVRIRYIGNSILTLETAEEE